MGIACLMKGFVEAAHWTARPFSYLKNVNLLSVLDLEMRLGFLGRGDAMTEVTNRGPAQSRPQGAGPHSGNELSPLLTS